MVPAVTGTAVAEVQRLPAGRRLVTEGARGEEGCRTPSRASGVRSGVSGTLVEPHTCDESVRGGYNLVPRVTRWTRRSPALTGVMAPNSEHGQSEVTATVTGLGWRLAESSIARTWIALAPEP